MNKEEVAWQATLDASCCRLSRRIASAPRRGGDRILRLQPRFDQELDFPREVTRANRAAAEI